MQSRYDYLCGLNSHAASSKELNVYFPDVQVDTIADEVGRNGVSARAVADVFIADILLQRLPRKEFSPSF